MTEAYYGGGGCGDGGFICTKQKLSQILLLCGMDQKNGVTSITKDKEKDDAEEYTISTSTV